MGDENTNHYAICLSSINPLTYSISIIVLDIHPKIKVAGGPVQLKVISFLSISGDNGLPSLWISQSPCACLPSEAVVANLIQHRARQGVRKQREGRTRKLGLFHPSIITRGHYMLQMMHSNVNG